MNKFDPSAFAAALDGVGNGDKSALLTVAHTLMDGGVPLLLIGDQKVPVDMRGIEQKSREDAQAREEAKDRGDPSWDRARSRSGVHLATTNRVLFDEYVETYRKRYSGELPNLAMALTGKNLVVVDADNAEGVADFQRSFRDATRSESDPSGENIEPTVLSPGKQLGDGSWAHRHGGHIYLTLPAGVELPAELTDVTFDRIGDNSPSSWTVMIRDRYVLLPPSVRSEGPYRWQGGIRPCPDPILQWITGVGNERATRAAERAARVGKGEAGDIDRWAAVTTWESLLVADGWWSTPSTDACGCPIFTAPGVHSSPKSATAHDMGCTRTGTEFGHGPLHIWTDNPPEGLTNYRNATGSKTLTKLQYSAWTHHGGNEGAAISSLRIGRNLSASILGFVSEPGLVVHDVPERDDAEPNETPRVSANTTPPQDEAVSEPWRGDPALEAEWKTLTANGFDPSDKELYPQGFHSDPDLLRAIMDYSDQTRAVFHAARGQDNVHPVGLLLMELVRAGMRAPVDLGPYLRVPLSTFIVLVGRSGMGKGQSSDTKYSPFPDMPLYLRDQSGAFLPPDDLDQTHELGSGQVLVDLLMEEVETDEDNPEGKGKMKEWRMREHPAIHLSEDEFSAFLARMGGPNSTICTTVVSAWSGKTIGTASRNAGTQRRTSGQYSMYFTGGLQPRKANDFFQSEDVGLPQRFIWSAVGDPYRFVNEPQLANPGPVTLPKPTIPPNTFTFTLCTSIKKEKRRAALMSSIDELSDSTADIESHKLMVRIRLACLFALWHGSLDVTEEIWSWSGAVMEHSDRARAMAKVQMERARRGEDVVEGERRAVTKQAEMRGTDQRVSEVARRALGKLQEAGSAGLRQREVLQSLSGKKARGATLSDRDLYGQSVLEALRNVNGVTVTPEGRWTYAVPWTPGAAAAM